MRCISSHHIRNFTYPLDIVRTRLSNLSASFKELGAKKEKLPGVFQLMVTMDKTEGGFLAPYRHNTNNYWCRSLSKLACGGTVQAHTDNLGRIELHDLRRNSTLSD